MNALFFFCYDTRFAKKIVAEVKVYHRFEEYACDSISEKSAYCRNLITGLDYFSGNYYWFSPMIKVQSDAKKHCLEYGGQLAIIPNYETQNFIATKGISYQEKKHWMENQKLGKFPVALMCCRSNCVTVQCFCFISGKLTSVGVVKVVDIIGGTTHFSTTTPPEESGKVQVISTHLHFWSGCLLC